jgi:hypothetical protein
VGRIEATADCSNSPMPENALSLLIAIIIAATTTTIAALILPF